MEEHFGFDITNDEAEKITSVMDAIQIFHSNVQKRQAVETTEWLVCDLLFLHKTI